MFARGSLGCERAHAVVSDVWNYFVTVRSVPVGTCGNATVVRLYGAGLYGRGGVMYSKWLLQ